jgi:hypothetical protein
MPSIELLRTLRNALIVEQEKRQRQRGLLPGVDGRTQLYLKLDQMRENRDRLGSPYPEMSPKERADLETYLRETAERHATAAKS